MPNANYDSVLTTTIEARAKTVQDNVKNNNAIYLKMSERGNIRPFPGGHKIIEPLSYAENTNAGWYSGAEVFTTGLTDELTAPEYAIKQLAVPIVITGLDEIKNSGPAAIIDLLESKVKVGESTLENRLDAGAYADGTGSDGKELTGLGAAVPITNTNTYGNIDRSSTANTWWKPRSTGTGGVAASATILGFMNTEFYALTRGVDHPDLIVADDASFGQLELAMQNLVRYSMADSKLAEMGFTTLKYKNADVVLSTGLGGNGPSQTMFFLNTKYIHLRPYQGRNVVALPDSHRPFNQDVTAKTMVWAGNLTCSGSKFHSRLRFA